MPLGVCLDNAKQFGVVIEYDLAYTLGCFLEQSFKVLREVVCGVEVRLIGGEEEVLAAQDDSLLFAWRIVLIPSGYTADVP